MFIADNLQIHIRVDELKQFTLSAVKYCTIHAGYRVISGIFMVLALSTANSNTLPLTAEKAAGPAVHAIAPPPANPLLTVRSISIEQLGYKDGLHQEGASGQFAFFLPLPHDVAVTNAHINLKFNASPLLGLNSSLRISINGIPRQAVSLASSGKPNTIREVSLPLTEQDLQKNVVEISLLTNFINSDERCVD